MDVTAWQSQLRKGAVELAVLAVLDTGEAYGLQILARCNADGDLVADGALYPLLARLERAGRIAARWDVEGGGNPRKYYRLTAEGRTLLAAMRTQWIAFRTTISTLVEGRDRCPTP